jgi:formylglycine-generating enzyme required for sulfatase activity
MGSRAGHDDEAPEHDVFVSAFEMADTPVSNRDYAMYLEATSARPPRFWSEPLFSEPQKPVVGVSWFEAFAFCEWLSAETGFFLRLPTEAEREKAARGGRAGLAYPWGNDPAGGGHPRIRGPLDGPLPSRSTAPNAYGLFHLADNVHEWCADFYDPGYYARSPSEDPRGPERGERRASRGGSWRHQVVVTRSAARSSIPPGLRYADYGFRWVRPLAGI